MMFSTQINRLGENQKLKTEREKFFTLVIFIFLQMSLDYARRIYSFFRKVKLKETSKFLNCFFIKFSNIRILISLKNLSMSEQVLCPQPVAACRLLFIYNLF
jgi:hypothetical protein